MRTIVTIKYWLTVVIVGEKPKLQLNFHFKINNKEELTRARFKNMATLLPSILANPSL